MPAPAIPLASRGAEDDRVEAMMLSSEARTRTAAHALGTSWSKSGGEAGRQRYRRVLWAAWERGERSLDAEVRTGALRVREFRAAYTNWRALGREAVDAVRGELSGSGERLASLDDRYRRASESWFVVEARLSVALQQGQRIEAAGAALAEIEERAHSLEESPARKPVASLRDRLAGSFDGRALLDAEPQLLGARGLRDAHFEADQFNRRQGWAPLPARDFAGLLNTHRRALGLMPMRLERRLWEACADHAREMRQLGYFAHESPTPDRRTPDRRAELAAFGGQFEGENLFQSRGPQAPDRVFRSWWASDSHRYVLFSEPPNALGLDPGGGTHWALMTGRL